MAWNTPGKNNDDRGSGRNGDEQRRNPWPPPRGGGKGGGPLDGVLDPFKRFFGGDGGGPLRWVGILLAVWLAFNCFVLIGEQQRGVVLRFGQFARIMQPGPNLKLPWPLERVQKVNTTGVREFANTVTVLTRDENIVIITFNVQFNVGDAQVYLFGTRDAEEVLRQTAISTVREQIGRANLDTALNARGPLSVAAMQALQASLETYRTGLFVTQLNIQNARPPEEVKPAFDEVNSAQQMNERLVNEARAYEAQIVPEARGQAARVRAVAEGYKTASIARASGDAQRFTSLLGEYRNAPEVTRKRLWLETLQQVLAGNRKVVGGDSRQLIYVPMTGQGGATAPPLLTPDIVSPAVGAAVEESRPVRATPRPTRGEGGTR